jgi:quercetin dioxygenase-like cupin family protein
MAVPTEELGQIATKVLFENDQVRIWNLIVDPGESSDWHLHENDYVTVAVEGEGLRLEFGDGKSSWEPQEPGKLQWHGEHAVHRVVNTTGTRYKNVLIELLQ